MRFLMQFQADLLGVPVEVAAERETTALGPPRSQPAAKPACAVGAVYEPKRSRDEVEALRAAWRKALDLTRSS